MTEPEETREIKLIEGRESGTYGAGSISLISEAGKTHTISRNDARVFVDGGNFEYVEEIPVVTKESLMKLKKDELVKMAMDAGASLYVERLTKDQLADYISIPAERDAAEMRLISEANQIETTTTGV